MDRSARDEIEVLTGSRSWSATPDNYSSSRFIRFGKDGTGEVIYGYGQTIFAKIACRYAITAPGRLRFDYLETPRVPPRPPFVPSEASESKEIGFTLMERESVFQEDVTGFTFRFTWTLTLAEPPYPDGLSFPYSVPTVFFGYREQIPDEESAEDEA